MNKKRLALLMGGSVPLWKQIDSWQTKQTELVHVGGQYTSTFTNTNSFGNGNTFIIPEYAISQDCYITTIKLKIVGVTGADWKFKLFRHNGTNYSLVSEVVFVPAGTGVQTVTLSTPLLAQMADIPSLFIPASNNIWRSTVTKELAWKYAAGDITSDNAFSTAVDEKKSPCLECFGINPYLAVTGDSIPGGSNTASVWIPPLRDVSTQLTIPGGNPTAEIPNQLSGLLKDKLKYQNYSLGSTGFDWIRTTGITYCLEVKPHTIIIHSGINDVAAGVSWVGVESDLDAILTAVNVAVSSPRLLIDEILPWTAGDDTQAEIIRTYNDNLATWCTANGATLILCHDEMGQIRETTGELDDLLTAYDQDGVHLTAAGVAKMAEIWKRYL